MASTVPTMVDEPRDLRMTFERLRAAAREQGAPSYEKRREWLTALASGLRSFAPRIVEAASADFGSRSKHETLASDVYVPIATIENARRNLHRWMRPTKVKGTVVLAPATTKIIYEPLGVVGVIAPWNYPVNLAIAPFAEALAAGNRVILKPSEISPATSEVLRELVDAMLDDDVAAVITGGAEVAQELSRLPFDHLVFTGSTAVGKQVMRAASDNLTPVTLELGGKSPVIVHRDAALARATDKVGWGKCWNAGQTCVAPDYALVHESQLDAFADGLMAKFQRLYPYVKDNSQYSSIVNARHYQRLQGLIDDARGKGAVVRQHHPEGEVFDEETRKIPPTLIVRATPEMKVMQEEIFGPVLPLIPYRDLDEAIRFVNDRPKPLAFYYFDEDLGRANQVLARTSSGGVIINDVVAHFAQENLGIGGVGASGMGRYHGLAGFRTFSNARSVMTQSPLSQIRFFHAPFTPFTDKLLKWLIG